MLITTLETVVALAVVGGVTEGQVSSRIIKNLKNHYRLSLYTCHACEPEGLMYACTMLVLVIVNEYKYLMTDLQGRGKAGHQKHLS